MKKNTGIIIAIVTLIVGLGVGYLAGSSNKSEHTAGGMHRMPNGQLMSNDGEMMDMSAMMADMNAELRGKTGDAFDQAFLSEMIVHHQGAVEMAELALKNAKHQEIKDLAEVIISAQNKEIQEMKNWQKDWYNK